MSKMNKKGVIEQSSENSTRYVVVFGWRIQPARDRKATSMASRASTPFPCPHSTTICSIWIRSLEGWCGPMPFQIIAIQWENRFQLSGIRSSQVNVPAFTNEIQEQPHVAVMICQSKGFGEKKATYSRDISGLSTSHRTCPGPCLSPTKWELHDCEMLKPPYPNKWINKNNKHLLFWLVKYIKKNYLHNITIPPSTFKWGYWNKIWILLLHI